MIPFNVPPVVGSEREYLNQAISAGKLSGDGAFTRQCHTWFEEFFGIKKALLTTSCTHALEMAALLADIQPGDEVIMPSYTFVSTANAFVLRGAKIVFVDIRPDTMNINERFIESAITKRTKAIVPVHYAGVSCEMETIMQLASERNLSVIEDAAQAVMSKYKEDYLGTIGHLGCYSFHETKNYTCGEGGAISINQERFIERAEIIREKGTNRSRFFRGQVDKYTWVDIGSSYLPSELNAAYLYAQLLCADETNRIRLEVWNHYYELLKQLQEDGHVQLPVIPTACEHNAHMFYIKVSGPHERAQLIDYLKMRGIQSVFHYVPLHSSEFGKANGRFSGDDTYTTAESERLLRLPLYRSLSLNDLDQISSALYSFYKSRTRSVS